MTNKIGIWRQITRSLETKLSKEEYNTWFSQTTLYKLDNNLAVINVPNKFVANWLKENYIKEIKNTFKQILKEVPEIRFHYLNHEMADGPLKTWKNIKPEHSVKNILSSSMTFENFITGECNKFAYSASLEVATRPGKNYNPLYLYSELSQGKTHLLSAISNYILKNSKSVNVGYLSAEDFFLDINYSFRKNKLYAFKDKYLNFDIILFDDIHLITNKQRAQEEFLSIFNTLYSEKKQIVISSNRQPNRIKNITPQLESCLSWGLIVGIEEFDHQTKIKIITNRIKASNINIPKDIISFLAKTSNDIKILNKNLTRIETYISLNNKNINILTLRNIIKERDNNSIDLKEIQVITSSYFNISISDIISDKKKRLYSYPRHIAMYLSRKHTDLSFQEIGYLFGDKDHSTVVYAIKKIEKLLSEDKKILLDLNNIDNLLT